ncbi:hypothetical protein B6V01_003630 [Methanosarcinales archaeon ex4572_44]|nr:MAG: hypothetical protein B6V01_003630 [Methanosarcinales archaeon ex4572_44]
MLGTLYVGRYYVSGFFQDIASLSRVKNEWIPGTGASIWFMIGIIGEKLLFYIQSKIATDKPTP